MSSTVIAADRCAVSAGDRSFLRQLRRRGPQTISQLCKEAGVTANAVRQRLSRLLKEGLVEREKVAGRRGRPFHQYRVSSAGEQELGDDYASLAKFLWREVQYLGDGEIRSQLLGGVRQALVERYRPERPVHALGDRFEQLREVLDREGFDVETDTRRSGGDLLPILREHHCPYHELAAKDRSICELEQSVFAEVLGVQLALTQCRRNGMTYCEFEPAIDGEDSSEATVGKEVAKR